MSEQWWVSSDTWAVMREQWHVSSGAWAVTCEQWYVSSDAAWNWGSCAHSRKPAPPRPVRACFSPLIWGFLLTVYFSLLSFLLSIGSDFLYFLSSVMHCIFNLLGIILEFWTLVITIEGECVYLPNSVRAVNTDPPPPSSACSVSSFYLVFFFF